MKLLAVFAALMLVFAACTTDEAEDTTTVADASNDGATETTSGDDGADETTTTQGDELGDAWERVKCESLGVAPEIEPLADCGTVTVPEARSGEGDRTIELAVVRLHSQASEPGAPLVLATGGPGGDGLGSVANPTQFEAYAPLLADRDLVFFSQRGTKHAEPRLDCVDFGNAQIQAAQEGWSAEEREAASVEALQACVDGYRAQGIDLSAYNSVENADDVDSIREALGYERIILNGQSYGTLLTQFVMQRHPDILEAVIIDGILPKSAVSEAQYDDYADAFARIWAACAADEACGTEYPDPEGALAEAYAALEAEPQPVDMIIPGGQAVPVILDGSLAMQALFTNSVPPGGYASAPMAAYALRDGDTSVLSRALWLQLNPEAYDVGMFYAIVCSDDPVTELTNPGDKAPMYVDADNGDEGRFLSYCPVVDVEQLGDESDEPVVSDIPALLLQGGLDGPTAPANGDIVETGLTTAYNVVFPAGTHIQAVAPCAVGIMQAFMADPMTAPDTSCIPQDYAFQVPLSVSATSEDGSASFSFTLPPGFGELPDGSYGDSSGGHVALTRFNAEPSPAQAIEAYLAGLESVTVADDAEIVDGEPVAGLPSAVLQTEAGLPDGREIEVDVVAFGDDRGNYMIVVQHFVPLLAEPFRSIQLPAILKSVTID